jgi:hypothetical protein
LLKKRKKYPKSVTPQVAGKKKKMLIVKKDDRVKK